MLQCSSCGADEPADDGQQSAIHGVASIGIPAELVVAPPGTPSADYAVAAFSDYYGLGSVVLTVGRGINVVDQFALSSPDPELDLRLDGLAAGPDGFVVASHEPNLDFQDLEAHEWLAGARGPRSVLVERPTGEDIGSPGAVTEFGLANTVEDVAVAVWRRAGDRPLSYPLSPGRKAQLVSSELTSAWSVPVTEYEARNDLVSIDDLAGSTDDGFLLDLDGVFHRWPAGAAEWTAIATSGAEDFAKRPDWVVRGTRLALAFAADGGLFRPDELRVGLFEGVRPLFRTLTEAAPLASDESFRIALATDRIAVLRGDPDGLTLSRYSDDGTHLGSDPVLITGGVPIDDFAIAGLDGRGFALAVHAGDQLIVSVSDRETVVFGARPDRPASPQLFEVDGMLRVLWFDGPALRMGDVVADLPKEQVLSAPDNVARGLLAPPAASARAVWIEDLPNGAGSRLVTRRLTADGPGEPVEWQRRRNRIDAFSTRVDGEGRRVFVWSEAGRLFGRAIEER